MADINKRAPWVTARLLELGKATEDGKNVLITDANIQKYVSELQAVYDDTTENWNAQIDYIPRLGAVIIYSDYATLDGQNIPNIKIGDGMAYLVDLPFVADDLRDAVLKHISNTTIHVTAAEKDAWNNKVTCYVELLSDQEYKIIFSHQ